jgi:hypothetical protein
LPLICITSSVEAGAPGFAEFVDVVGVDFVLGGEAGVVAIAPEDGPVFDFRRRGGVGRVAGRGGRVFATGGGAARGRGAAPAAGSEDDRRGEHAEAEEQGLQFHGVGFFE